MRKRGFIFSAYIDDIIIIDESYDACIKATVETIKLLDFLGFVIHHKKSNFVPSKFVTYLGFTINSESMIGTLPSTKVLKIKDKCSTLCMSHNLSIRDVASVIGSIVSTFPAVKFGPLHYRALENEKIQALDIFKGNFTMSCHCLKQPMMT